MLFLYAQAFVRLFVRYLFIYLFFGLLYGIISSLLFAIILRVSLSELSGIFPTGRVEDLIPILAWFSLSVVFSSLPHAAFTVKALSCQERLPPVYKWYELTAELPITKAKDFKMCTITYKSCTLTQSRRKMYSITFGYKNIETCPICVCFVFHLCSTYSSLFVI